MTSERCSLCDADIAGGRRSPTVASVIASHITIDHNRRHIVKVVDPTDLRLPGPGRSDGVAMVIERLERLACSLADLPCGRCGGRTDVQPVSFAVDLSELHAALRVYVVTAIACGGAAGAGWAGVFGSDVLGRVGEALADAGHSFPRCVAFLTAAVAQASLAGWSHAIDHALVTGRFNDLIPNGACACPARGRQAPPR